MDLFLVLTHSSRTRNFREGLIVIYELQPIAFGQLNFLCVFKDYQKEELLNMLLDVPLELKLICRGQFVPIAGGVKLHLYVSLFGHKS